MQLQAIEKLALRLRGAIEAAPRQQLPSAMSLFPHGACSDSSLILGAYFSDNGIPGFQLVCGNRGSHEENAWESHAWLAKGDVVVDITADQFDDAPATVIVSTASLWHKSFTAGTPEPADFREHRGFGIPDLARLYAQLRPALFTP